MLSFSNFKSSTTKQDALGSTFGYYGKCRKGNRWFVFSIVKNEKRRKTFLFIELVANANAIKNRQELALTRSFDEKLKQQTMTLFRVTEFLIRKFPPKSSSEPNVRVIFTKDLPMWPNVNSVESARKIMDGK